MLQQLTPLILENRGRGRMAGFRALILEDGTVIDTPVKITLGGIEFTVTFIDPWTPKDQQTIANHGGMVIHAAARISGSRARESRSLSRERMRVRARRHRVRRRRCVRNDAWVPGRRLNGDQTHQGRHIRLPPGKPQIQKVRCIDIADQADSRFCI